MKTLLVLALFLLVFGTGTAYAECAWVLWWEDSTSFFGYRTAEAKTPGGKTDERSDHSWGLVGAYPTAAACNSQQASKIDDMLKSWRKDQTTAQGSKITITHEPGGNIISQTQEWKSSEYTSSRWHSIRYLCLPDTVDPRGAKGK